VSNGLCQGQLTSPAFVLVLVLLNVLKGSKQFDHIYKIDRRLTTFGGFRALCLVFCKSRSRGMGVCFLACHPLPLPRILIYLLYKRASTKFLLLQASQRSLHVTVVLLELSHSDGPHGFRDAGYLTLLMNKEIFKRIL
jgi:hypothetical protein